MRAFDLTSGSSTISFNSDTPDSDGVYWLCADLDGWESTDPQVQVADRLSVPGQFATAGQLLAKTMTVRGGLAWAPTENARRRAKDRLAAVWAAMADTDLPATLVVYDPSDSPPALLRRTCLVYGSVRPQMLDHQRGRVSASAGEFADWWPFEISGAVMVAPDPIRYQVDAATVTIPNSTPTAVGPLDSNPTAPMPPKFFLSPDTSAHHVTMSDGTHTVVLDGDMSGVTTLVVDFGAQTVLDQADVDRFDLVASSPNQWWALDPAASTVTVGGLTGDAVLYYTPSWY